MASAIHVDGTFGLPRALGLEDAESAIQDGDIWYSAIT